MQFDTFHMSPLRSKVRELLRSSNIISIQIFAKELEFARNCQWDFASFVSIFQFAIQQSQFQPQSLCENFFDLFMYSFFELLTHAKIGGDFKERVIT